MSKVYVLGSINMDMVITAPYMPACGETLTGEGFFLNSGGKGANQAVACAKQQTDVCLIGSVGRDVFGDSLLATLADYGVDVSYVGRTDGSSGVAVIVVVDSDNRIILDSGANGKISREQIDIALRDACCGDVFVTQLENNTDAVIYGLQLAKSKGLVTVFNPAPAIPLDTAVYRYVDYLVVNQSECQILSGVSPHGDSGLIKAYNAFKEKGVSNLIVTLGADGSVCFADGKKYVIPANKVQAVDTTAAGDTYVGVFASELAHGAELQQALNYASYCSSLTCLKKGAQQAIPTRAEASPNKKQ